MPVYLGNESIKPPWNACCSGSVVVILIGGCGLGAIEAEGIGGPVCVHGVQGIRIVVEQSVGIAIHRGRSGLSDKPRLSSGIESLWIGAEVVVERDIFLKDDDEMLDRCGGPRLRLRDSWIDERPGEHQRG